MGELCNQSRRTVSNLVTQNNPIPVLHGTSKDHKPAKDQTIGPEMRPIMSARFAPNSGISQIGCEFLKAIIEDNAAKGEVKSTEEVLNVFNKYNEEKRKCMKVEVEENPHTKKVIGSMDVKSFYPSIKPEKVALIARHMWNRSNIKVRNIDIDKLTRYISKEIDRDKIKWLNLEESLWSKKLKENIDKKKKNRSFEDLWDKPAREPSDSEVKTMVGLIIENIVKLGMSNHLYQFANEIRLQQNKGPTGYDLTGLAADVYMLWWDHRYAERLEELRIKMDINVRFKDDLTQMTDALPLGTRYNKRYKELQYTNPSLVSFENFENEKEREIFESNNPELITFHILTQIANDVDSMISFTFDVPSKNTEKKVPILDLNVYLDQNGLITHEFYEKPTNSEFVILAKSALSMKTKRTVFTQECLRRMRNTSLHLGPEVSNKFLSQYMLKLQNSGYSKEFRSQIIKSAKHAFQIQIENDKNGVRPLFRDKARIISDQKLRCKNRVDWWNLPHHNNPDIPKYTSILFVPPTPGGNLAKQIQSREAEINSGSDVRIKVVERGGIKLKSVLVNKNPYPALECHRKLCPYCKITPVSQPAENSKKFPCTTPSVGYQIDCLHCKSNDNPAAYIGETGRTAVTRGIEHVRGIMGKKSENPMYKHLMDKHTDNMKNVKFEFGLTGKFRDPLTRQAEEGLRIARQSKNLAILNTKSEFNHPPIARVKVSR